MTSDVKFFLRYLHSPMKAAGTPLFNLMNDVTGGEPVRSAEHMIADVAAGGGDLAQLVEEVDRGQVERAQLACGPDAAGPNCHGIGEHALNQVVGGVLEGGPVAMGEAAKAKPNTSGGFLDGQG
jgi:hypothetical protein